MVPLDELGPGGGATTAVEPSRGCFAKVVAVLGASSWESSNIKWSNRALMPSAEGQGLLPALVTGAADGGGAEDEALLVGRAASHISQADNIPLFSNVHVVQAQLAQ